MFENRYLTEDKILKEYIIKVISKKMFILCSVFIVLLSILLLGAWRERDVFGMGWYSSGVLILLVTMIGSPYFMYMEMKKMGETIHNHQTFETVVIFDDKIHLKEGDFSLTIDYTQIKKIHQLKYSCVLMFSKNQGIIIKQNSFVKGSFDEFLLFMNKKTGQSIGAK